MVSVIDNQQATQVYQTSASLYGQMWDQILTSFVNASRRPRPDAGPQLCPYCQQSTAAISSLKSAFLSL